jgi:hypothetical protein
MHTHSFDAEFTARTDNANSDLTTVGDEDFFEWFDW